MDLHWKLISSRTIGNIRIVRWAARTPDGFIFRECAYEVGHGGLLAHEDDATKRLLQTRYGHNEDTCLSMTVEELLAPQPAALPC
jgi:hypothetical protein